MASDGTEPIGAQLLQEDIPTDLKAAFALAVASFGSHPEVTGIDIGCKYVEGKSTEVRCVRVHVRKKRDPKDVPAMLRVPPAIDGVPTDVVEALYSAHVSPLPGADPSCLSRERHSTLRPGISIGNEKGESGTLGLLVVDRETGDPCVLSAAHVLVGAFGEVGDPITQPARIDGGRKPADTVAHLLRFFAPGLWGDAAVARLSGARPTLARQLGSGKEITGLALPQVGQVLEKSGRTTNVTRGRVEGIGTYFYPHAPNGVSGFRLVPAEIDHPNQDDLSAIGDSGAIWYDPANGLGVGLHCGGEVGDPANEFAIACNLSRVLATLGVSLVPLPPTG